MGQATDTAAFEFDRDTAVTPCDDGRWEGVISERWGIPGGIPNGGYVMAVGARTMGANLPHPDPVSLTAHFLRPARIGPVAIEVETIRSGKRHSTAAASLVQDGEEVAHLLGSFADLDGADGPSWSDGDPPGYPAPDDCLDLGQARDRPQFGIFERFDWRVPTDFMGWTSGQPLGRAEMGGWLRLADGRPADPLALVVIADAFPPAIFNTGQPLAWVPTMELTVHVRRRPVPGWLRCRLQTHHLVNGYLEEDGEIWDSAGNLVALSRQLALARRPRSS